MRLPQARRLLLGFAELDLFQLQLRLHLLCMLLLLANRYRAEYRTEYACQEPACTRNTLLHCTSSSSMPLLTSEDVNPIKRVGADTLL